MQIMQNILDERGVVYFVKKKYSHIMSKKCGINIFY